ncbi:MAG TPA: DUF3135 domain-containing protein [Gammaproteobacteria bacterium]|nr:DUF3135 domain-containing protein [Gammaproteobacteria bacterium]
MQQVQTEQAKTCDPLIDFDQFSKLAKSDPEAFEARRAELIEEVIQRMPVDKQHRMRCLQWRIDQVRKQASNPMAACIKLSEMMWDSLVGPGGLREALERISKGGFEPPPRADVLEFPHRA